MTFSYDEIVNGPRLKSLSCLVKLNVKSSQRSSSLSVTSSGISIGGIVVGIEGPWLLV